MALAFPDAYEAPHFDRASFRVGKKIFATMAADGLSGMVRVAPLERLEAIMAEYPEAFFSFGGWTRAHGSLGVNFAAVDPALLRVLMEGSFAQATAKPKRTRTK